MFFENRVFSEQSIDALKERLRSFDLWFPYPCLISFGLIMLFTGHILLGLNPRLGNPAHILPFATQGSEEGSLWFSVSMQKEMITITTADRKIFQWPKEVDNLEPLDPFITDLKSKLVELTLSASLAKKFMKNQSLVVLAVDQSLTYAHIKPIIYALASAGISEYAFETRQPLTDKQ